MSSLPADVGGALAEARSLAEGRLVTVLTGAGISTDAGIPDFRGPDGVWTRNPGAERLATLHHYLDDEDVRKAAWRSRLESPVWAAEPTEAHRALVRLEEAGRLHLLVTQNTDGLHRLAGTSAGRLVEIHRIRAHLPVLAMRRQPADTGRAARVSARARRILAAGVPTSRAGDPPAAAS